MVLDDKLKKMLTQSRYIHSVNVAEYAIYLSEIYGADKEKAYIAGMLHDCAKCLDNETMNYYIKKYDIKLDDYEKESRALAHSIIGVYIAKHEFKIDDEEILNSIKYHTTGNENMTLLEKIIYIADLTEKDRDFNGVEELRYLVENKELDKALLTSLNNTISLVIKRNHVIHPRTVNARNYLIYNAKK